VEAREKREKRRKEKRKEARQRAERIVQRRAIEKRGWLAERAFHSSDCEEAMKSAMQAFAKLPEDRQMFFIALHSARSLKNEDTLFEILTQGWRVNILSPQERLEFGEMALSRGKHRLAEKILRRLAEEDKKGFPGLRKTEERRLDTLLDLIRDSGNALPASKEPRPSLPALTPPIEEARLDEDSEFGEWPKTEVPEPALTFAFNGQGLLKAIRENRSFDRETLELADRAWRLSFRSSYEQLLCLPTLRNVQSFWYQEETARKVMRTFRGRAILADEVGLGKTIEAGLILKEYILRGLVRSAIILVPSSLVDQWQEELAEKFDLSFKSSNDPLFRQDPGRFWKESLILASLQTARHPLHFANVTSRPYDFVIVDEAHHLKNRASRNWKLINSLQKTFLLLLTATPVENKLEELYNLVTLLKPGHLKTLKAFREEFVTRGNPTDPRNREKLRGLLKEVMVRNTRSITRLRLPPRFALTVRTNPTATESGFYRGISDLVSFAGAVDSPPVPKPALRRLLEAAGSSHFAALRLLSRLAEQGENGIREKALAIRTIGETIQLEGKTQKVLELLRAGAEQKILFVNYLATLEYLQGILTEKNIPHAVFHGSLSPDQKQQAMETFRQGCPVLLTTGIGGEGHNLQFCHVMVNYDLPWNPMQIEQRIGRIHRIGQEKDVQVYNFCAAGSVEDHILEVLDKKINMFELVVGEMEMILGHIEEEQEFSDRVFEIWLRNPEDAERKKGFDRLAEELKKARRAYEKTKEFDQKLFHEDFGL
jgi:superfamily II DNA or RNA helicase